MIKKYFDIKYYWKDNKPIIQLKLKKELMLNKENRTFQELNGNSRKYYIFHYGNVLGNKLKDEYNKVSTVHARIKWYVENVKLSNSEKKRLLDYRSKYLLNVQNKNKEKYSDKEFKLKFNVLMNNPKRVKNISERAKEMWNRAKTIDVELYRRMTTNCNIKKYELNEYKMNSIEYLIGLLLNKHNCKWEYETIFNFDTETFLPDFYIRNKKTIIECYGDYWHANPNNFKPVNKIYRRGKYNISAADIWNRDGRRKEIFEKNRYTYLYFWETDIKNNIDKIKGELINEQIIR